METPIKDMVTGMSATREWIPLLSAKLDGILPCQASFYTLWANPTAHILHSRLAEVSHLSLVLLV